MKAPFLVCFVFWSPFLVSDWLLSPGPLLFHSLKLWIRYKKASLMLMRLILFPSLPFPSPVCFSERTGKTSQKHLGRQVLISHVQSSILTLVTVTQLHLFNASTKICRAKKKRGRSFTCYSRFHLRPIFVRFYSSLLINIENLIKSIENAFLAVCKGREAKSLPDQRYIT